MSVKNCRTCARCQGGRTCEFDKGGRCFPSRYVPKLNPYHKDETKKDIGTIFDFGVYKKKKDSHKE